MTPTPNSILSKARVLVIDDESSNVRLLERILEMFGCHHVRSTTDPREAMGIYLEQQPDIILLDLHMPHLDGFALMEQFRAVLHPDSYVPILVLTADITLDTKRRALASGARDLVTKPIDHSEVILRIKNLLENRFCTWSCSSRTWCWKSRCATGRASLRKRSQRLQSAQERVVRQERLSALGMMASGIAHDFNNALTMVLGYAELLLPYLQTNAPAKERDYIQHVMSAAQDATHVVSRLKEFYRPSGKRNPRGGEPERHRHADRLHDRAQMEQPARGRRGADQRAHRVAGCARGSANAAELREVLTNLIFNAVDAMPAGGEITVRTSSDDAHALLAVTDSGIGMTDEERERCLEPFFSTKGDRGTGLGLSVVYGIIHRHGGTIEIASEKHRGTTFTLRLPVSTVDVTSAPAPAAEIERALRILVVDDQEIICELISEYLQCDGHEPVTSTDPRKSLEIFAADPFDLVITDQSMPGINGVQLANSIKTITPETPVILLTGFGDEMQASGSFPLGVDLVLGKPVSAADLRTAVYRAMTQSAAACCA